MEPTLVPSVNETTFLHTIEERSTERKYGVFDIALTVLIVIYAIVWFISIVGELIVAFIIVRNKTFQLEASNIVIFHFVLVDILFMVLSPLPMQCLCAVIEDIEFVHITFIVLDTTLYVGTILIMALLTIYWCIKLYFPNRTGILNKMVTYGLIIIFAVLGIFAIIFLCKYSDLYEGYAFVTIFVLLGAICIFILVAIVHCMTKNNIFDYNQSKDHLFKLLNAFFLSKLPFALLAAGIFTGTFGIMAIFLMLPFMFVGILSILNGIYFFIILYRCNDDYHKCLRNVLRCKCNSSDNEIGVQPVRYIEGETLMGNGH